MARMRTIQNAFKYIKEQDEGTEITLSGFRTLIKKGFIKSIKVGNKTLVNLDTVEDFFNSDWTETEPQQKIITYRGWKDDRNKTNII